MSRFDRQRLEDIIAAIDAVGSHMRRGDLGDGLIFDAVRLRLIEIGEAVKALSPDLLATRPDIPWTAVAQMKDRLTLSHFDTSHAIVAATVDGDLPELDAAVRGLLENL